MPWGPRHHARLLGWGLGPAKSAVMDTQAQRGVGKVKGREGREEPGNKDTRQS